MAYLMGAVGSRVVGLPGIHPPRPYGMLDVTTPLQAHQKLLAEDPEQVGALLATPVRARIEVARFSTDFDDILARLSDWDVYVELGVR